MTCDHTFTIASKYTLVILECLIHPSHPPLPHLFLHGWCNVGRINDLLYRLITSPCFSVTLLGMFKGNNLGPYIYRCI